MSVPSSLQRIHAAGLVAVVRAERPEQAVQIADALLAGGVLAIELTFTTPGAVDALKEVRARHGREVLLGAGTIREVAQVEAAVEVGVDFMVTAHLRSDVLAAMLASGVPFAPGVFTPTEVGQALDAGARAVKLFPASTGGPAHLRALRGPFPDLQVIPTGGIVASNILTWFAAGALAVGAGGELVPRAAIEAGDWDGITRQAERFADATRSARAALQAEAS